MQTILDLVKKEKKNVIGLMSGTSLDGIDVVLTEITGNYLTTKVKEIAFLTIPYNENVKNRILDICNNKTTNAEEICLLNFLIGELFADACKEICEKANFDKSEIDLIGSHGQTIFHIPFKQKYLDKMVNGTLQIGEGSIISERMGCITVNDFRTRDISAGGQGAPLVPYTEFLIYKDNYKNIALQNIGGIGNITILEKNCNENNITAFDTGPGNMIIDSLVKILTKSKQSFDFDGEIAARGKINEELLSYLLNDDYLNLKPPKTTGREKYNISFIEEVLKFTNKNKIIFEDIISTVTFFTAKTIQIAIEKFCKVKLDRIIIGGGGAKNKTLLNYLKKCLYNCEVLTNEDLGFNSDSKEAVAFAILANEAIHGKTNNLASVTGAEKNVIMGKINF